MITEENKRGCILDNFNLINQKEIIDFIRSNTGLLELIEKVYPLLQRKTRVTYNPEVQVEDEILRIYSLLS